MPSAGKLGRTAPHPRSLRPRVALDDHIDFTKLPRYTPTVDRASRVSSWPMYLNDQLGDCTCAGVGHAIQALTAYGSSEVTLTDDVIEALYMTVGGYVPGQPQTDNGANMQDILDYWTQYGVGGHKISAYAELKDFYDPYKLKEALYLFGTVYLGIDCPASAQEQFGSGQPWTYVPGSPIEGGHAIVLQEFTEPGTQDELKIVTWGALQGMNFEFAQHYIEEAWVMITPDWIQANGNDVDGFSLTSLQEDFAAVTSRN